MNNLLDKYFNEFGDFPPLIYTFTFEDDIYINLMENALKTHKAITRNDLNEALKDVEYDNISDTFDADSEEDIDDEF